MPYNMLWNIEVSKVIIIDFKQAKVLKPWAILGVILLNQKRKWVPKKGLNKQLEGRCNKFVWEM